MSIKFVSYDGKYPNLCHGALVVNINGQDITFGLPESIRYANWETQKEYIQSDQYNEGFWVSGGNCGFYDNHYSEAYCNTDAWQLDKVALKEQYKPYAQELIDMFNENVSYGCCGGCL